jgi:hypothetical protein
MGSRSVDVSSKEAYQRIDITGGGSNDSETRDACARLVRCMKLRAAHVYQKPSYYWGSLNQSNYPEIPIPISLDSAHTVYKSGLPSATLSAQTIIEDSTAGISPPRRVLPRWQPFVEPITPIAANLTLRVVEGVYRVFSSDGSPANTGAECCGQPPAGSESDYFTRSRSTYPGMSWDEFERDYYFVLGTIHEASIGSFAHRRLDLLQSRFVLHRKLNVDRESTELKVRNVICTLP